MKEVKMVDVLVIGSGGAGLVAAISAKEAGATVKVVGKSFPTRSQTCMAQGGINAALANVEEDSVEAHIKDTLKSAQGLADEAAVRKLCEEALESIQWLDRIGLPFSRTNDGKIAQRRLGGASGIRACYAQDYTGLKILHSLYDYACKIGIEFVNEHFLLNYIVEGESDRYASGATFLNIKTGEAIAIRAKSVVIATGGYSQLYRGFTTNSTASTGDGLAAAVRAGARLSDVEFVQFHPTALKTSAILISESARGAGGYLLNAQKERFTDELAPRDIVARAIADEIEKSGEVYLDIRHLGEKFIDHELPQERKLAIMYEDVDPVVDLIPIKPVAHYTMGGVDVDAASMSCIKGLYAAGEAANHKVHGANRLGGNSLLELIVFGRQAGVNAASYASAAQVSNATDDTYLQREILFLSEVKAFSNTIDFYEKRDALGKAFYENAGIKRTESKLQALMSAVQEVQKELPLMGPQDKTKCYNTNLCEFLEFMNVVELSEVLLLGAIERKESRGAHYREDIPQCDDDTYAKHTVTGLITDALAIDFKD
jgi:succinate dehydrogenase / fumarate reductase flavoprotein subunit